MSLFIYCLILYLSFKMKHIVKHLIDNTLLGKGNKSYYFLIMNKDQPILEKRFSHNSIYSHPQSSLFSQSQSWPSFAITVLILLNWFYKTLFVIYILTLNNNYFFIYLFCQ